MKEEVREQLAEMLAGEMANNRGTVTIREGKAIELKEPVKVNISGTIDAPARWLEARHDCLTEKTCHVLVDREAMTVSLRCNENDHYGSSVTGSLQLSQEYKRFGINSGQYVTNFELAELIKMNRSYFENKTTAMKLVTELQNFKARVNKEIEQSDNNRGDRRMLLNQAVQHNLPEAFNLLLPIFKGIAEQTIQVEVYVNPADLTCTLVSPEANDIVVSSRDSLIDSVIDRIQKTTPDIVIIEK